MTLEAEHGDRMRMTMRTLAAQHRERLALERYIRGWKFDRIAADIGVHPNSIDRIIKRGLARRAEQEGPTVAAARAVYTDRLEALAQAWLPLALGEFVTDDETGQTAPPNPRAAEVLLKVLTDLADVQGVRTSARVNVDLTVHSDDPQEQRNQIMLQLAQMAAKSQIIDGHLADAGAALDQLTGATRADDKPPPPPVATPPTQEGTP